MPLPTSVFQEISDSLFSFRYEVEIHVGTLVGGIPTNKNIAEGWIRTKMGLTSEEAIKAEVEKVMEARGVKPEEAIGEVNADRHLTGFMRDYGTPLARADQQKASTTGFVFQGQRQILTPEQARVTFGELIVPGRHVKAMAKEAAMIGVGSGHIDGTKWGRTGKAMKGFLAEHLFVEEEEIYLGVTEPSEVVESFVHTFRGTGIKREEHLHDAVLKFTLIADWDFEAKVKNFYGILFSIAERNGLGASRSQGYGRFAVTRFERVESDPETTAKATKRAKQIIEEDRAREAERLAAAGTVA